MVFIQSDLINISLKKVKVFNSIMMLVKFADLSQSDRSNWVMWQVKDIQIKICAEYRDMLPRPRLVCQEPGLRPIGRSPGVPDKSSRGLGSMSRYSAQILICFIAYIFSIFNFSVGLVGNLAELPPCTVPPATVHCYQNEAAQCSSDNQISQHALLRGSRKKHSLAFMPQNWWN